MLMGMKTTHDSFYIYIYIHTYMYTYSYILYIKYIYTYVQKHALKLNVIINLEIVDGID